MKNFLKFISLPFVLMCAVSAPAYAVYPRPSLWTPKIAFLPPFLVPIVNALFDIAWSFVSAVFMTVAARPFITAGVLLLMVSLFKVHDMYERSQTELRWRNSVTNEHVRRIFKTDTVEIKSLGVPFFRRLYVLTLVLLLSGIITFSYTFFCKFKTELQNKKISFKAKKTEQSTYHTSTEETYLEY